MTPDSHAPTPPRVSVIVPVYNVRAFLPECLDSLLAQSLADLEVICVDDGSTDGSDAICERYAAQDRRVSLLRQTNQGAGAARNAGIEAARGEYLFFCDADDFCKPTLMQDLHAAAKTHDADLVVFSRVIWSHESRKVVQVKEVPANVLALPQPFHGSRVAGSLFTAFGPQPWNKFVRRALVMEQNYRYQCIPRNNDIYFSDMSLALAGRIVVVPVQGYIHRVAHGGNLQACNDRSPFAVFDAYTHLKASLESRGLFAPYETTYYRAALSSFDYIVRMLDDPANITEFYARIRAFVREVGARRERLGADFPPKAKARTWANMEAAESPLLFLQRELRDASADVQTLAKEKAALQRRLKGAVAARDEATAKDRGKEADTALRRRCEQAERDLARVRRELAEIKNSRLYRLARRVIHTLAFWRRKAQ